MFVLCKKDVIDTENNNEISYASGKLYESKIVLDQDLLEKDNTGEFALIGVNPKARERLGLEIGISKWGSWFDEYFELTP